MNAQSVAVRVPVSRIEIVVWIVFHALPFILIGALMFWSEQWLYMHQDQVFSWLHSQQGTLQHLLRQFTEYCCSS